MIPLADLEREVDNWITSHPTYEVTETVTYPGNDNAKQLDRIGREIRSLTEERFGKGIIRDDYHSIMAPLEAEYARLYDADIVPDRTEVVGTGKFLSEEWPHWDAGRRRHFLIDHKFRFVAMRDDKGKIQLEGIPGEAYRAKAAER